MNPEAEINSTASDKAVASSSQEFPDASSMRFQKQVKHGLFKWSIEKFSCYPAVSDKYILSPIFELKETWWYLTLHPKAKIYGQDNISLNLIRHRSDPGPQKATVAYRLGLECDGNKAWFRPEERVIFEKGNSYGIQTSVLGHLEDFLTQGINSNNDTLSVLCEIYVVYEMNVKKESRNLRRFNIDLDLMRELTTLFTSEDLNDVVIEIPKIRARAHKSVLSARSKTLARMLESGCHVIQLSCTPSCLFCVFAYMYSGSYDFLTEAAVFSIGIYELACELSLSRLRDLLAPYNIELKSVIIIDDCKLACTLYEFSLFDISTRKIESRVHFDRATGIGVKIDLEQRKNDDYVVFCVKVSGMVAALDFSFGLYVLDESFEPYQIIRAKSVQNSEAVFQNLIFKYNVLFSVSDIMNCASSDGNVYLNFAYERYSLRHLTDTLSTTNMERTESSNDHNYWIEDLSLDLKALLETGYLSDITISSLNVNFKVHRSILAARSEHFSKLFSYDQYKNKVLEISNFVDPPILELILSFMYTGVFFTEQRIDKYHILDLYKAAEEFNISSLKKHCPRWLIPGFTKTFVFVVLDLAEEYKNSYLITECNNYISKHKFERSPISSSETEDDESSPEREDESEEEEEEMKKF